MAGQLLFQPPEIGVLECLPDAMLIIDDAGAIVFVNSQAEIMFGYSREELLGVNLETRTELTPRTFPLNLLIFLSSGPV